MVSKKLLFFMFFIISFFNVGASTVTNNLDFEVVAECFYLNDISNALNPDSWDKGETDTLNPGDSLLCGGSGLKYINYYSINQDRRFQTRELDDTPYINDINFPKKYQIADLDPYICEVNLNSISGNLQIESNLNPPGAYDVALEHTPDSLKYGYYMKTLVYAVVSNNNGVSEIIYPDSTEGEYEIKGTTIYIDNHIYSSDISNGDTVPYVLAKPNSVSVSFADNLQNKREYFEEKCTAEDTQYCGDYNVVYHAVPIDLKCDFHGDNILGSSQVSSNTISGESFSIKPVLRISSQSPFEYPTRAESVNQIDINFVLNSNGTSPTAGSTVFPVLNLGEIGVEYCKIYDTLDSSFWRILELNLTSGSAIFNFPGISVGEIQKRYEVKCYDPSNNPFDIVNKFLYFKLTDIDLDGVPDEDDLCPTEPGSEEFQGCPTEYSEISCSRHSSFLNSGNLYCDYRDCWWCTTSLYFKFDGRKVSNNGNPLVFKPNRGSGVYTCYDRNVWPFSDTTVGSCELRHNAKYTCEFNGQIYFGKVGGQQYRFYKYPDILTSEVGNSSFFRTYNCSSNGWISQPQEPFIYSNPNVLRGPEYEDMVRIGDTTSFTREDSETRTKFDCDYTLNVCRFVDSKGDVSVISLNDTKFEAQERTTGEIRIYKQGELDRVERVDPREIALHSHRIQRSNSVEEVTQFVNKTFNLMNKFNVIKNLTFEPSTFTTNVKINLDDIPLADRTNITIYQVLPKSINFNDINVINNGGGELIVLEKNPVIGWYFNESPSSPEIEYEIPGDVEGGVVIITQEPILFNQGDLIVNYREAGCLPGEAHLFDIDDLENSVVKQTQGSGIYSICVAHINLSLYKGDVGSLSYTILDYEDLGNVSINNILSNNLTISVNNNTEIYWAKRISTTSPTEGKFSCIGSIDLDSQTSRFGDCGWTTNRIWLHLGPDVTPPEVEITYPFLAHTLEIDIMVRDDLAGSGMSNAEFCVVEKIPGGVNDCIPNINIPITDRFGENFAKQRLVCSEDWGCTTIVKVNACDVAGNCNLHVEEITSIDKGSSCQADCTAKPSPNRYLKECRNLNFCEYFAAPWETGLNLGEYVANQCDLRIEGSWVEYNSTHEILCPKGPFRESRFTNSQVFMGDSQCDFIKTTPFVRILDGEQIIMNIISCMNFN